MHKFVIIRDFRCRGTGSEFLFTSEKTIKYVTLIGSGEIILLDNWSWFCDAGDKLMELFVDVVRIQLDESKQSQISWPIWAFVVDDSSHNNGNSFAISGRSNWFKMSCPGLM